MRTVFLASVAALTLAAVPMAFAQSTADPSMGEPPMADQPMVPDSADPTVPPPPASPAQPMATSSGSADVRFVNNEMVQSTPAPRQDEYPVCKGDQDDNCINASAARKNR